MAERILFEIELQRFVRRDGRDEPRRIGCVSGLRRDRPCFASSDDVDLDSDELRKIADILDSLGF